MVDPKRENNISELGILFRNVSPLITMCMAENKIKEKKNLL